MARRVRWIALGDRPVAANSSRMSPAPRTSRRDVLVADDILAQFGFLGLEENNFLQAKIKFMRQAGYFLAPKAPFLRAFAA